MKISIYSMILSGILVFSSNVLQGQDLDELLEKESAPETTYTTATFKSTRIVNGHSIERMKNKQLEFRVSHRFGQLNEGSYNLWGLDQGTIHLALEYGLTDWLEAGIGRSTYEKTFDGFGKVSILRQSSGDRKSPVHLTWLSATEIISLKTDPNKYKDVFSRMSFVQQFLVARKFNERFSVQLSPTYIHRNLVPTELDKNDLFALGCGGRYKFSKRVSLNIEYFYVYRANAGSLPVTYYNPVSVGFDLETGGHVFQIMLTNSQAMREGGFIGKTTGNWRDGGIHLGFNISRVFSINH